MINPDQPSFVPEVTRVSFATTLTLFIPLHGSTWPKSRWCGTRMVAIPFQPRARLQGRRHRIASARFSAAARAQFTSVREHWRSPPKHQSFGDETLISDNVFGTATRTLDFTRASRGSRRRRKTSCPETAAQPRL